MASSLKLGAAAGPVSVGGGGVGSDGDAEPEEEEYVDDDDDRRQYEDFGVSAAERRGLAAAAAAAAAAASTCRAATTAGRRAGAARGARADPCRAKLEEWLNEPFLSAGRSCVVRLAMDECGVGPGAPALYRVAVVAAVDERGEYTLAATRGSRRARAALDFGERRYEMKPCRTSV